MFSYIFLRLQSFSSGKQGKTWENIGKRGKTIKNIWKYWVEFILEKSREPLRKHGKTPGKHEKACKIEGNH